MNPTEDTPTPQGGLAHDTRFTAKSNQVVASSVNKRWRAVPFKRSTYWIITDRLTVSKTTDKNRGVDSQRYKAGNYFQTQEQAIAVSKVLKGVLTVSDLITPGSSQETVTPSRPKEQDDKQLRETVIDCLRDDWLPGEKEKAATEILALFQKEQIQLVSELEGEAEYHQCRHCKGAHLLKAVSVETLEHKKQELERGK